MNTVMVGLDPAIRVWTCARKKDVDARLKADMTSECVLRVVS